MRGLRARSVMMIALVTALVGLVPGFSIRPLAANAQVLDCSIEGFADEPLEIMAPAAPGGGWDTTAREMQRVMDESGVAQRVDVFNVEGAGGTVGLSQLVNDEGGNEHQLMMMGLVMIGGIATNQAPVTLDEVTPIARLTTEFEVIVVPENSAYQTLDDLIAAFEADPSAISWGGGSAGGTDHILVGLMAEEIGVDPTLVNYVPFSGGGEALAAILGGQVSAGVSGVGEWQDQIASGKLRALAVSGAAAVEGTPVAGAAGTPQVSATVAPTLQEQGIDVELANWRGVVAPPAISPEARQCLISMVEQMRGSAQWAETLAQYGWQDYFLPGDEYTAFLASERDRITEILRGLGLIS